MLLNIDRALAMMKESKVDALIATQPENVTYLTDYEAWLVPGAFTYRGITLRRGFQNYGVLTPDGARGLIVQSISEAAAIATFGWQLEDMYIYGHPFIHRPPSYKPQREDEKIWCDLYDHKRTDDGVTALMAILKKRNVTKGRVAIELANLAPDADERLRSAFTKIEFVDAGELFARIRYVKTPSEIERLRHAALVNERGLQAIMKALKPGVTEIEMRKVYRSVLAQEDGDIDFFTCAGGLRAGFWSAPGNYAYKAGDHIIIDPGCRVNCYHADTGCCGSFGEPSKKQKEAWHGLIEIWNAGLAVLKAGLRPSQFYKAMADVQKKIFGYVAGYFSHGIGIEAREGPFANKMPGAGQRLMDIGQDPPYEAGMVILLEIPIPVIGFGGVHREETFIITEKGWEPLIHTMRDLHVFSV